MLTGIGFSEILIILLIALVVVGPEKIPDVARMLGKGVREVRRASNMFRDMFMIEEGGDYRQQDRRNQLDEERRDVGVSGTVTREQRRKVPPIRPVLLEPPRRATHTQQVELAAAAESATVCTHEELAAARAA